MSERDATRHWSLREARPGDERGILDCLTAAFGGWPGTDIQVSPLEHLSWKLQSDVTAYCYARVAVADERIVGCRLAFLQRVAVRDRILLSPNFTDLAVLPEYRGQGIMRALWKATTAHAGRVADMEIGLGGQPAVQAAMVESGKKPFANAVEVLDCDVSASAGQPSPAGWTVRKVACFDEGVDGLWAQAAADFDFAVVRTKEYLNWRYADPRAGPLSITTANHGEKLLGYVVLGTARGKAFIADLLVLPRRTDVVDSLIASALGCSADLGVQVLRSWCPAHHPYRDVLLDRGFAPKRGVEGLMICPHRTTGLGFATQDDQATVHVMAGDTDVV